MKPKHKVYNILRWDNGTCLFRICRECWLKLSKAQRHPDFGGPADLDMAPLIPGQTCADCGRVLEEA